MDVDRSISLMKIECVLECANHLGEGPVWDVEDRRLYWVDGTGRRVGNPSIWRLDPRPGKTAHWSLDHDVGAMALRRDGGAVLALDDGFYFFDFTGARLDLIAHVDAEPAAHAPERRQVRPPRPLLRRRHGRQGGA